jgi:hypothetical protein
MRTGLASDFPWPHGLDRVDRFIGDTTRLILYWPGVFTPDGPRWTWYDQVIARMGAHGQQTIVCIAKKSDPPTLDQYLKAVRATAYHYRGNVNACALELWNEPNLFGPLTPQKAAQFGRYGVQEARRAGWQKPLLIAAPAPVRKWGRYLAEMDWQGLPDAGVAFHPYPERRVELLRSIVGRRGLWVTEYGWSTADVDEAEQARKAVEARSMLRDKGAKAAITFRANDPAAAPNPWEGGLGVCRKDWSPKLAWGALSGAPV